jgi:hypothetical protein
VAARALAEGSVQAWVCSLSTRRSRSAQRLRARKALTSTLDSKKTRTRLRRQPQTPIVIREPAGNCPVRQSLVPEALKAHELELTPECIAHNLTAGAACFCAGSFQPRWPWKASVQAGPHH